MEFRQLIGKWILENKKQYVSVDTVCSNPYEEEYGSQKRINFYL